MVQHSFQIARKANPSPTLILNDFDTSNQYASLIQNAIQAKSDFDVIGIQSPMHTGFWGVKETWDICERFARFRKPIHFTELTIISGSLKSRNDEDWQTLRENGVSTPEGEQRQSKQVSEIYHLLFSHPAVDAISWWDVCDRSAWQGAPGGLLKTDLTPKPAYCVMRDLIRKGWSTHLVQPVADSTQTLRGFFGTYQATVTIRKQKYAAEFALKPDHEGLIRLQLQLMPRH